MTAETAVLRSDLEGGDPPLPLFHRRETAAPACPVDYNPSSKWLPGRGLPIDEGRLSKGHIKAGQGAFRKAIYKIKPDKKSVAGNLAASGLKPSKSDPCSMLWSSGHNEERDSKRSFVKSA